MPSWKSPAEAETEHFFKPISLKERDQGNNRTKKKHYQQYLQYSSNAVGMYTQKKKSRKESHEKWTY